MIKEMEKPSIGTESFHKIDRPTNKMEAIDLKIPPLKRIKKTQICEN